MEWIIFGVLAYLVITHLNQPMGQAASAPVVVPDNVVSISRTPIVETQVFQPAVIPAPLSDPLPLGLLNMPNQPNPMPVVGARQIITAQALPAIVQVSNYPVGVPPGSLDFNPMQRDLAL